MGKEKKHFNMIELLKVEEKKKKGGIGVSTKAKTEEGATPTPAVAASKKPTAQDLLAVKLRRKEAEPKASQARTEQLKSDASTAAAAQDRCSTTEEELEALFSAIDQEINDDPDAVLDLLDVLEDHPEASVEMQEEMEVIKSSIYLPPEDEYEMELDEPEKGESTEDEEMKEMLEMIENAKGEIDTTNEEELVKMMDRLDDEAYFEKLRNDVLASEERKAKELAEKSRREAQEMEDRRKKEAEEKMELERVQKSQKEAEEKAKKDSEERVKREANEKAKKEADDKAKREAEERAKKGAEEKKTD